MMAGAVRWHAVQHVNRLTKCLPSWISPNDGGSESALQRLIDFSGTI
jgi:hypothetical protein